MQGKVNDVVVVGAGYAGVMAANRFHSSIRVTMVSPDDHFVHRIRLHEQVAGGRPVLRWPLRRALRRHIETVTGTVDRVEPGLVTLSNGRQIRTRHSILTVGSTQPAAGGIDTFPAACAARRRLAELPPGAPVLIRGGGLTGIELATEVAGRRPDLAVHLVDRHEIGGGFTPKARAHLVHRLEQAGVQLCPVTSDIALELNCTGMGAPELPVRSGLPVDERQRLRVGRDLHAGSGVWGAGDAVRVVGLDHLRGSCAAAQPMGAHVADNVMAVLSGEPTTRFDFGFSRQCVSLGRRDGLIMYVDPVDHPTGRFITGRRAALTKGLVCWGAMLAPVLLAPAFRWRPGMPTDSTATDLPPHVTPPR